VFGPYLDLDLVHVPAEAVDGCKPDGFGGLTAVRRGFGVPL
jgi:hypothetical protein